jgi:hypothetical protein
MAERWEGAAGKEEREREKERDGWKVSGAVVDGTQWN